MRARVPVGRRSVVGLVLEVRSEAPEGFETRRVTELVDAAPILPADLIELGRFVADYYLAPPGEVYRAMLPAESARGARRRVRLTDAGAIVPPRDDAEAALIEILRRRGPTALPELMAELDDPAVPELVDRLERRGRLARTGPREGRTERAVELSPRPTADLLAECGRSRPGREVVELLSNLGRPATVREVLAAVGCGAGVVRRLARLGIVRSFDQLNRRSLAHHRLAPSGASREIRLRPTRGRRWTS